MVACGQTKAHLLHWMHTFGSQTGTSSAMRRFSHFVVPSGQVPSTGKADTGSRSPLPAIITAVTRRTKSGAPAGTSACLRAVEVASPGTGKPKPPALPDGIKRTIGGQPGHPKHERPPFPPEQVNHFEEHTLDACPCCGGPLRRNAHFAKVVQQVDIEKPPLVIEQHTGP